MHIKSSFCKMIRGGQGVDNTDKISSYPNSSQIEGKPDLDTIQIKEADLGHEIVLNVVNLGYGSTGCGVFKRGVQESTYPKEIIEF
jgi:hypothetical protein